MDSPNNNNNNKPSQSRGTIMLGSDFFGGRRDSLESQGAPDSRRGSMDGPSPSSSSPMMGGGGGGPDGASAAQQQKRQQQRGRFWGIAQVDCTTAPFSA